MCQLVLPTAVLSAVPAITGVSVIFYIDRAYEWSPIDDSGVISDIQLL